MRKTVLVILCLALSACGKSEDKDSGREPAGFRPMDNQDITDYSVCHGPPARAESIFEKSFRQQHQSENGGKIETILVLRPDSLTMTANCEWYGQYTRATVNSTAQVGGRVVKVVGGGEDAQRIYSQNQVFVRSAKILGNTSFEYDFQGPCLRAKTGTEVMLFVPSR